MRDGPLEHGGVDETVRTFEHQRCSDRHACLGTRGPGEAIPDPDRHDRGARHQPGEPRCAGPEHQRRVARALASLREPPQHAPRSVEKRRGMAQRQRTVACAVELDTDAPGEREEPQLGESARIHQRECIAARDPLRHDQRDEPVPPRRVVRHAQHRTCSRGAHELLDALDAQRSERRAHAGFRATSEPSRERSPPARGNHLASHAATSAAASGTGGRASASRSSGCAALRARHSSTALRHHVVYARVVMESHPRARIVRPMSA